jgi:hypothetical protein
MPSPSPGPIAKEVIAGVSAVLTDPGRPPLVVVPAPDAPAMPIRPAPDAPPMPTSQVGTVTVKGDPTDPPFLVRDKANPLFGTAAWWYQKGGPVGIICFLLVGTVLWMGNAQREATNAAREGTNAVIKTMSDQQATNDRRQDKIVDVMLSNQMEISANMARLVRTMDKVEARLDKQKDDQK